MSKLSDYHDYRLFLRDWVNERQTIDSSFTWRIASVAFGIETAALFRICSCERHLPLKFFNRTVEVLGLQGRDVQEFKLMVELGRCKKPDLQKNLRYQLLCLRSGDAVNQGDDIDARYFSSWLHPVLFSILHTDRFSGGLEQVAKSLKTKLKPKASLKEISESLELLLELGLVEAQVECWIPTQTNPNAKVGWTDGRIRNFQHSCLDLAATALETQPKENRNFTTLTLHLTVHARMQIEQEIQHFRNRVKQIVELDDGADLAMQLNVQLFSLINEDQV